MQEIKPPATPVGQKPAQRPASVTDVFRFLGEVSFSNSQMQKQIESLKIQLSGVLGEVEMLRKQCENLKKENEELKMQLTEHPGAKKKDKTKLSEKPPSDKTVN